MRIALCPDSFKESLSAMEVAHAMARGAQRAMPECETVIVPIADGGEGTVDVLTEASGGTFVEETVTGPLGDPVVARYGLLGGDEQPAVIEMAAASGLPLVPPERRNPLITTTYGTGQLILSALDRGAERIVVGIGGSATVDGGAGMAEALGVRFLDEDGDPVPPGGGALGNVAHIDLTALDPRVGQCRFQVASDVENPLIGPDGAARVYGPQKGATPEMVEALEANLAHLAEVMARDVGVKVANAPGAGAAGGLGGALIAFLKAELRPGFDILAEILHLGERLRDCDLLLTGEGRMDGQAIFGKAPIRVARLARECGVPTVALVGTLGDGWQTVLDDAIDACFSICEGPVSLEDALRGAEPLIERTAEQIIRTFALRATQG